MAPDREKITALILAGGQAKRMQGADKGLLLLDGKPLVAWVLECIAPQVDEILISANRNIDAYAAFGHTILQDRTHSFDGPLAGLLRGLEVASHDLVLCVPCDTPFLPGDLALRLYAALKEQRAQIAVAATEEHIHRTICLCRRDLLINLAEFMKQGGRRVGAWQEGLRSTTVMFSDALRFRNFNTPQELLAASAAKP
jgi:molybdopterin-guanine dinucleotide biosynthesis protein A